MPEILGLDKDKIPELTSIEKIVEGLRLTDFDQVEKAIVDLHRADPQETTRKLGEIVPAPGREDFTSKQEYERAQQRSRKSLSRLIHCFEEQGLDWQKIKELFSILSSDRQLIRTLCEIEPQEYDSLFDHLDLDQRQKKGLHGDIDDILTNIRGRIIDFERLLDKGEVPINASFSLDMKLRYPENFHYDEKGKPSLRSDDYQFLTQSHFADYYKSRHPGGSATIELGLAALNAALDTLISKKQQELGIKN